MRYTKNIAREDLAYAIELMVADRTYHYGSLEAYRYDIQWRTTRIKRLGANANRDGVTKERKDQLLAMLKDENHTLNNINKAMQENNREYFQSIAGTPAP